MTVDREQTRRDTHAQTIREKIAQFVPTGFRDEDGVWHEGPHQRDALEALGALLAELEQAERERDEADEYGARMQEECGTLRAQLAKVPAAALAVVEQEPKP